MKRARHAEKLLREHWLRAIGRGVAVDPKVLVIADARCVYVPVPKSANSSVRRALCPSVHIDPESVVNIQGDTRLPIRRYSEMTDELASGWSLFTVVRNPFERALSGYRDKVVRSAARLNAVSSMGIEANDSFATFLAACRRMPVSALNDHFMPQSVLLAAPLTLGRLKVYHAETLSRDWTEIADNLREAGAPRPDPVGVHRKIGSVSPHSFTPREADLITKLYAADFCRFGYCTAPPGARP